jgi:DNA-binding HxlR family transcriptional regulator
MDNDELLAMYRVFHVLGDTHALKILYQLDTYGEQTFSQLRDTLSINPRSLSNRLKKLKALEFIHADSSRDSLRVFYNVHDNHQKSIKKLLDAYERLAVEVG